MRMLCLKEVPRTSPMIIWSGVSIIRGTRPTSHGGVVITDFIWWGISEEGEPAVGYRSNAWREEPARSAHVVFDSTSLQIELPTDIFVRDPSGKSITVKDKIGGMRNFTNGRQVNHRGSTFSHKDLFTGIVPVIHNGTIKQT